MNKCIPEIGFKETVNLLKNIVMECGRMYARATRFIHLHNSQILDFTLIVENR